MPNIWIIFLLLYAEHLDHLKEGRAVPWPLPKRYFRPEVAARTYEEYLEAWALMDGIGFDCHGHSWRPLMDARE